MVLPAPVYAQLSYMDNGDGTAIIAGCDQNYSGAMVIPDTINGLRVTSIGDMAFFGCINLAGITIPSSITNIGSGAFNSCLTLTNVEIPASVTSIGDYAFFYCTNLMAIEVNATNPAYSSADGVLFNKDQTTLMQFPFGKGGSYSILATVTNLADGAFGINAFGDPFSVFGFSACSGLTNLSIPGSVGSIGAYAFSGCSGLTSVALADGISSIGTNAFFLCSSLASISFSNSVNSIGDLAFYYSGLASVTIPGSVTNLGLGAFAVCGSLTNVTMQDGIGSIGERAFNYCTNLSSVTIPGSVTSIGKDAFFWSGLTNVTIENGVSSIGESAFDNCLSLKNVTIPGSVTNIGDYAFYSCSGLININLPNGVSSLGADAFAGCVDLPHIEFPDSLTSIGQEAFSFCYALTNVTIPSSVTNIGPYAFAACQSLANIHVNADNAFYSSVDGILCSKDQTVLIQFPGTGRGDNYSVPSSITSISSYSFANNFYMGSYSVSVPSSGSDPFPGTDSPGPVPVGPFSPPAGTNLVSVIIPSSVTNIGNEAFAFIQNLKGVYFTGNAPAITECLVPLSFFGDLGGLFLGGSVSTVYYLPGTTGWDTTFGGVPTELWLPQMQVHDAIFGGRTNRFDFNINWASGRTLVVEASTNLHNWQPVQTNTLTTGSANFSDLEWTNYPGRFYRLRSP